MWFGTDGCIYGITLEGSSSSEDESSGDDSDSDDEAEDAHEGDIMD